MTARGEQAKYGEHMGNTRGKTPILSADAPTYVDGPVPPIKLSALIMGVFISRVSFMYGYAVGQTAGYLETPVFLDTFGSKNATGDAYFYKCSLWPNRGAGKSFDFTTLTMVITEPKIR